MKELSQERLRRLSKIAAQWWVWKPGMTDADDGVIVYVRTDEVQYAFVGEVFSQLDVRFCELGPPNLSDPATAGLLPFVGRRVTGIEDLQCRSVDAPGAPRGWFLYLPDDAASTLPEDTEIEAWVLGINALVRAKEEAGR